MQSLATLDIEMTQKRLFEISEQRYEEKRKSDLPRKTGSTSTLDESGMLKTYRLMQI